MKFFFTSLIILVILSCENQKSDESVETASAGQVATLSINCDLIGNWERAKIFTRQYLEAMPEEFYDFQPTPEILSFAHEFLHVACVNYRYAAMMAGSYDCSNYDDVYDNPGLQSKESVISFVMDSYDVMINRLIEETDLSEPSYFYGWSCSKECISMKGFEHQSHHRGKAAVYLRLKGITPPVHMLIEDWRMPKDISDDEWKEQDSYKNYERMLDAE